MAFYTKCTTGTAGPETILTMANTLVPEGRKVDYVYVYNQGQGVGVSQDQDIEVISEDFSESEEAPYHTKKLPFSGFTKAPSKQVMAKDKIKFQGTDLEGGLLSVTYGWTGPTFATSNPNPDALYSNVVTSSSTATQEIVSMVGEAIVNGREVSTVSVYNAGSATETVLLKLYDDSTTVEGIVGVLTVPSGTCVAHTSPIYMEDADILRYQCRHGEEVFVTTDWKDPKDAWKK